MKKRTRTTSTDQAARRAELTPQELTRVIGGTGGTIISQKRRRAAARDPGQRLHLIAARADASRPALMPAREQRDDERHDAGHAEEEGDPEPPRMRLVARAG